MINVKNIFKIFIRHWIINEKYEHSKKFIFVKMDISSSVSHKNQWRHYTSQATFTSITVDEEMHLKLIIDPVKAIVAHLKAFEI